jgi:hypothetical protein
LFFPVTEVPWPSKPSGLLDLSFPDWYVYIRLRSCLGANPSCLFSQIAHIICHRYPPASIPAFISVILLPPVVLTYLALSSSLLAYFFSTLVLYLSTLGTSIALYRLSPFHPLAKYPGPILARVSRLWATRVAASGRQNVVSHELFQRYGEVVRVGPDHLIILNVNAIPVVLGAKNPWPKNPRETIASCRVLAC